MGGPLFCRQCGQALPEGSQFCPACGTRVGAGPVRPAGGTAPSATAEASALPGAAVRLMLGPLVTLLGGALIALGSFLPWITASAVFVGTIERNGIDGGGDGILTLVLGIVVALAGLVLLGRRTLIARLVAIGAGLAAGVVLAIDLPGIQDRINQATATSSLVVASVGMGVWVIALGAGLGIVGALASVPSAPRVICANCGKPVNADRTRLCQNCGLPFAERVSEQPA